MRSAARTSKIERIRELVNRTPEPEAHYWMLEAGKFFRYNTTSDTWAPASPEAIQQANKKDWLFASDDDLPEFKGHIITTSGPESMRAHLIRCQCDEKDEIKRRVSDLYPVRDFSNLMMKSIFFNHKLKIQYNA